MEMFKFTGIVTKELSGYASLCPELDVASTGQTVEEAKTMLLEAATLHIEGAIEDGLPYLRQVPPEHDPRDAAPETVVVVFHGQAQMSEDEFLALL